MSKRIIMHIDANSIEELFLVGRATNKKLRDRGIRTIGELANCDPKLLSSLKSHGRLIWNYANGIVIENSPVKPGGSVPFKGLGNRFKSIPRFHPLFVS